MAFIQSWAMVLFQAVIALGVVYEVFTSLETRHAVRLTAAVANEYGVRNEEGLRQVATQIAEVHTTTNSMKDALVLATGRAADLAGEKRGIEIGRQQAQTENT